TRSAVGGDGVAPWGPYQTWALFLPLWTTLEPVKPVAAYLAARGYFMHSIVVLVVGEILKVTIVERLFHVGRPKLMMIPAFARIYNYVMAWYAWFEALPPWQAVRRRVRAVKAQTRVAWRRLGVGFRRSAQRS